MGRLQVEAGPPDVLPLRAVSATSQGRARALAALWGLARWLLEKTGSRTQNWAAWPRARAPGCVVVGRRA